MTFLHGFPTAPRDPWRTLAGMRREMDELFGGGFGAALGAAAAGRVYPPVNLYETEGEWVLTAELPGVAAKDLQVTVEGNSVSLRGERRVELPAEASLHRRERQAGVFRRSVELPTELDADATQASYRNGVLTLRVPKAPKHRPRHIQIETH